MKINSNFYAPYCVNFASSKNKKATPIFAEKKVGLPFKPVSEYYCVKPYYLERKGDLLSDTKKFSEYLENKIKSQMMVQSENDVQNIINNVVEETNADEKLVSEVLGRIAQFSSYKQLSSIGDFLSDRGVSSICSTDSSNLNYDFSYIFRTKRMYPLNGDGYQSALFIDYDNFNVVESEIEKENRYQKMCELMSDKIDEKFGKDFSLEKYFYSLEMPFGPFSKHKPTEFFIVDGWNYRKNGQTKSYTMLGAEDTLENTVKTIVQEIQETGKSVDDVLNGEIINLLKANFGDDFKFEIIKNKNLTDYSAKNIADIMAPNYPTAKEIEAFIEVASNQKDYKKPVWADVNNRKKYLSLYLDSLIDCYSPRRLDEELKKKYDAIEKKVKTLGKTMDEVYYIVPNKEKSFSMITRQYAKVNNVLNDKIISLDSYDLLKNSEKVVVLLDDFFGTGESAIFSQFKYEDFLQDLDLYDGRKNGVNVILAPVFSTKEAKEYVEDKIELFDRKGQDFFLANKVISPIVVAQDHLKQSEISDMLRLLGGNGYRLNRTCVSFPTSLPDNNSVFSNLLLSKTIQNSESIYKFKNNIIDTWAYITSYSDFIKQVTEKVQNENK